MEPRLQKNPFCLGNFQQWQNTWDNLNWNLMMALYKEYKICYNSPLWRRPTCRVILSKVPGRSSWRQAICVSKKWVYLVLTSISRDAWPRRERCWQYASVDHTHVWLCNRTFTTLLVSSFRTGDKLQFLYGVPVRHWFWASLCVSLLPSLSLSLLCVCMCLCMEAISQLQVRIPPQPSILFIQAPSLLQWLD